MQRRARLSLNEISHNCIIGLIQNALQRGICIQEVFVDLVGSKEETFQHFLQSNFPSLKITVSKKADFIFPIVGAASIFAKVTRDRRVSNLQDSTSEIGSGYPSDPTTKCYISKNLNPLFGFPSLVRFSWQTIEKLIGAGAVKCLWNIQGTDDCLKQYTLVDIWTASKKVERKDEREQHLKHTTKLIRHRFFAERNIANMDVFE